MFEYYLRKKLTKKIRYKEMVFVNVNVGIPFERD